MLLLIMRLHLLGLIGICLAGLALLVFTEKNNINLFAATTHTNIMAVPRVLARRVFRSSSSSSLFGFAAVNTPSPLVTTTAAAAATSAVRSFSSTGSVKMPSQMPSSGALVDLAKGRHSIYKLGKNSPVPDEKIEELVNQAILNVPSAFNTQSTRLVVLLHKEHERLWDITMDLFQARVKEGTLPEEMWKNQTQPKLQGFKNGLGTVSDSSNLGICWDVVLIELVRFSSMKTPRTSSLSRRNSLPTRTSLSLGPTILMLCISTSVCVWLCFLSTWDRNANKYSVDWS